MKICAAVLALFGAQSASAATVDIDFDYTGAIVTWVVPETTTYRITAIGAQGAAGDSDFSGGRGAQIEGSFDLTMGDLFYIAVGGAGIASNPGVDSGNGGGGGGTFFVAADDTPMLIAGGGGGTRASVSQNGTDASVTEAAYTASGSSGSYTPVLKTSGIGQGGIVSSSSWGSAGAGFFSNGAGEYDVNNGGKSWFNGLAGGIGAYCSAPAPGGFGGGGAGNGCWGGGGGGGYSGGDGGRVAGGGGSFNSGYDVFALAGVGYGNGSLTISYEAGALAPVPVPASLPLLMGGVAGLIVLRRKSKS